MRPERFIGLLVRTAKEYSAENILQKAASLSFFIFISLASMIVLITGLLGLFFHDGIALSNALDQIQDFLGEGARAVVEYFLETSTLTAHRYASIIGAIILIITSTTGFVELQRSLHEIFGTAKRPTIKGTVKRRFLGFVLLFLSAGVLIKLVLFTTILYLLFEALIAFLLLDFISPFLILLLNNLLIFGASFLYIYFLYRFVAKEHITKKYLVEAAIISATLFTIGKVFIELYLGNLGLANVYGAAGTIMAFLLWTYYNANIFYFGAKYAYIRNKPF